MPFVLNESEENETCYHQSHKFGDGMLASYLLYMVLPWLAGVFLLNKKCKLVLLVTPFTSVLAFIIDGWGTHYYYWKAAPSSINLLRSNKNGDTKATFRISICILIVIESDQLLPYILLEHGSQLRV